MEEIAQPLTRRKRLVFTLVADRFQQGQGDGLVGLGDEARFAREMMVDQAYGHARSGADAPYGRALMPEQLEAAQSRVHQRFAAQLGSRPVEFRYMPLGCH